MASLAIFAFISIKGAKIAGIFQTLLALILFVGVIFLCICALFSSKTSIANLSPGFTPGVPPMAGLLAVIAVAPWAFVGFDTIPQAAEEFNFSPTKAKILMIVSILFGGFAYVALNTITVSVIPAGYESWPQYIEAHKSLSGLISLPTFNAAHELLGVAGLFVIGTAVLAAILTGIAGFYMATSRLLYSMSLDGVLPKMFGKLHPTAKTPVNAILFIMLVSMIAPFFGRTALGWIVDMSSIGAAIGYGYTSLAAVKFAMKDGSKFISFTGILGFIFSICFAVLLLVPIKAFGCSLGKESYICLIIWIVLGIAFFFASERKKN